jgi:hypothetical protein
MSLVYRIAAGVGDPATSFVIQRTRETLPGWADTAATLPSNPSPLSEAGGRVLQFCHSLGCLQG